MAAKILQRNAEDLCIVRDLLNHKFFYLKDSLNRNLNYILTYCFELSIFTV